MWYDLNKEVYFLRGNNNCRGRWAESSKATVIKILQYWLMISSSWVGYKDPNRLGILA